MNILIADDRFLYIDNHTHTHIWIQSKSIWLYPPLAADDDDDPLLLLLLLSPSLRRLLFVDVCCWLGWRLKYSRLVVLSPSNVTRHVGHVPC